MPGTVNPDDYDDYDEEEYFDDYDDAADDWEAEAAAEEEKEKADAAIKAALAERKTQTRAPAAAQAKADKEEEEAPALPDDVAREVARMRQEASDTAAGGDLVSGPGSTDLLADAPTATAGDMINLGKRIADHLLSFASQPNFDVVLAVFCEQLGKEFKSVSTINENITRAEKALTTSRKPRVARKKGGAKAHGNEGAGVSEDALGMDIEDKGGACVEESDAFF